MRYFIDTNLIIDFLNKEKYAIDKLTKLASDDDSELFVNRLVYLESLRTIPIKNTRIFKESKNTFEMFDFLDISQAIYDEAINFSRYCKLRGVCIKGRCEAIDFVHFITAKDNELELLTNDGDMAKLEAVYPDWLEYIEKGI